MKKILTIVLFSFFAYSMFGQLAAYNFDAAPYLTATTSDANVNNSDLGITAGSISTNITFGSYFPNEPYIQGNGGWTSATQAGAKAFCFDIAVAGTHSMTITNVAFNGYATGAGPSAIGFSIAGTNYGATDIGSGAPITPINEAISDQVDLTGTVEVCIQGWDNGSRSTSGGGDFRLDDIIISGTTALLMPAPVELTSFIATNNQKEVSLSWTTASELNNSHFDIEYSQDGNNFRAIDQVTGNGTTQLKQEYSYTHTTPANGSNYYRLKQVDFDGAFEYSDIRVVEIDRNGKVIINPSAAIAEITVQLAETTGDNNQIGIYDMMGRTVLMSNFDGNLNAKTIDISNLQKGYYVVRVQAGSEIFTERFMKMVD